MITRDWKQHHQRFPTGTLSGVPYVVCCAYFGGLDEQHHRSVLALEYGDPGVRCLRVHGVPYIDQARAILAERAMSMLPDDGVMMWLDHDIIFNPASVPVLVERCATEMFDVLGVPYSMRQEGAGPIGFPKPPTDGSKFKIDCYDGGGLYEATGLGMGFTAIRMRVFRELAKSLPRVICGTRAPCWPFFALEIESSGYHFNGEDLGFYHGEDMSFCRRAIKAGFRVGLDTSHKIGHKGTKIYALEDCGFQVPSVRRYTLEFKIPENPLEMNSLAQVAPHVPPEDPHA